MSYEFHRFGTTVRQAAVATTGYQNLGTTHALITAGTATFQTNNCIRGDIVRLGGVAEVSDITVFLAASGFANGAYFDINTDNDNLQFRCYYVKDGVFNPPAAGGRILFPIFIGGTITATNVRNETRDQVEGNLGIQTSILGGGCRFTNPNPGACTNIVDGTTGFTFATSTAGTTGGDANDGTYIIEKVVSETQVIVRGNLPAPGGAGNTISVSDNRSHFMFFDEAAPTLAGMEAAHGDAVISKQIGSASAGAGFVNKTTWETYFRFWVYINNSSTPTVMNITDAIVVNKTDFLATVGVHVDNTQHDVTVNIGTAGTEDSAAQDSSAMIGYSLLHNAFSRTNLKGSVVFGADASIYDLGNEGEAGSSLIVSGGFTTSFGGGAGGRISSVINVSNNLGHIALSSPDVMENYVQASSKQFGLAFGANFKASGVRITDLTFVPYVASFAATVRFLDGQDDYLFTNIFSGSTAAGGETWSMIKSWTWSPQFVRFSPNQQSGVPISGLSVKVFEKDDATPIDVVSAGPIGTTYTVTYTPADGSAPIVANYTSTNTNIGTIRNGIRDAMILAGFPGTTVSGTIPPYGADIQFSPTDEDVGYTISVTDDDTGARIALPASWTNGIRELSGSPFTTDSNGEIDLGSGQRVELEREVAVGNVAYRYRRKFIIRTASNYLARFRTVYKPVSRFDGPVTMLLQEPDYEGEGE